MDTSIEAWRTLSCTSASSQRGHQYLELCNLRMRKHYHMSSEVSVLSHYHASSKIMYFGVFCKLLSNLKCQSLDTCAVSIFSSNFDFWCGELLSYHNQWIPFELDKLRPLILFIVPAKTSADISVTNTWLNSHLVFYLSEAMTTKKTHFRSSESSSTKPRSLIPWLS